MAGCLNLANYGYNAGRELGRLRPAGLGINGPDPVLKAAPNSAVAMGLFWLSAPQGSCASKRTGDS